MRYLAFAASLLISLRLSEASSLKTSEAIVDLGYAKYEGNITYPNVVAYLGIPYAEPPVGDRRYRAPAPLNTTRVRRETKGETADATPYPPPCIQGSMAVGDAGGAGSEDCLKVNVYAPLGAKKGQKLPVIVYFHGGAFVWGSAATTPFDHWVQQVPDVVAAAVYYRLDSFGFLPHPTNDSSLADHNVGFLDQTEALRWIQRYIDAFGGDPGRVTINGQSAGGASVEYHLVAPNNDGLFHAAIAQSVYRVPLRTLDQQKPLYDRFVKASGCAGADTAIELACLRNASVPTLSKAQDSLFNVRYDGFHSFLDGKVIPEYPTVAIKRGHFRRVPLIVGATSNETLSDEGSSISTALKTFFPALTNNDIAELEQQYPASDYTTADQQFRAATGESELLCAREIMGGAFAKETDVFIYRFNQPNPTMGVPTVDHGADDYFLFRGSNPGFNGTATFTPLSSTEESFAEELIAYWTSFVRTGDPNTHKFARSPIWPQFTAQKQTRIVLQEGSVSKSGNFIEAEPEAQRNRCALIARKALAEQN